MPVQYQGISAEHQAVRTACGLFDASHMGELSLSGPGAVATVDSLVTGNVAQLPPGKALYTCACREDGGILDDLIVYRQAADQVMVVCNASNRGKIVQHFSERLLAGCQFRDRSDELCLLALQGPRALEVLDRAGCTISVATQLSSFQFAEGSIGGVPCLIARTGYTGEDGVELFCPNQGAVQLWRALLEAGAPLGISPAGLGARDTLRLEARLSLYGHEIDESTQPFEAGLGWIVKLDKGEFLGRSALIRARETPSGRKLVGFEMIGRGIARHGYALLDGQGKGLGLCTSGGPSPSLGKNLGLGYVPLDHAAVGSSIWVDCRGKAVEARVVNTPFYSRKKAS